MALSLPQPVTDLINIEQGVALFRATGHPITSTELASQLTREERVRGYKVTVKVRGKVHASASDIFKIHRDWVARTAKAVQ